MRAEPRRRQETGARERPTFGRTAGRRGRDVVGIRGVGQVDNRARPICTPRMDGVTSSSLIVTSRRRPRTRQRATISAPASPATSNLARYDIPGTS